MLWAYVLVAALVLIAAVIFLARGYR